MYTHDDRIVITLDAGGTNLVFGAMRGCEYITEPVILPSQAHDLGLCLDAITRGFRETIDNLGQAPAAISFAFPGPADYPAGIIGGYLPNFPSFRDGVALGPYLEEVFGLPVFINNDGDLFAYGEALCGALPRVNRMLARAGSPKRYRNLVGYTFGTGFGVGIVVDGHLNRGDNSCVETFCLPHPSLPGIIAEEGVAVRAVKRVYAEASGHTDHAYEPREICEIADGTRPGDREAARRAFAELGRAAGHCAAIAAQLTDGLVVVGGGLTAARRHIMPSMLEAMRSSLATLGGETVARMQMRVFDIDDPAEFATFAAGSPRDIPVPGTGRVARYDSMKRVGVTVSTLGASRAISAGAYAFALSMLDSRGATGRGLFTLAGKEVAV